MNKWQDEFLTLLRNYYTSQRNKNPRYSMRALAQQLGTAPGPTSALIKGSKVWNISPEWALTVLDKMNIKSTQKNRLRVLMGEKPKINKQNLPDIEGLALSHWAYWPILACIEMSSPQQDAAVIATKLGISLDEVQAITKDLLARGFVVRDEDGNLQRSAEVLETADDILSLAAKHMHETNLQIAQKALDKIPAAEREFQTLTVAGSSQALTQIKQEIRAFTDKVAWILNQDNSNDQVYRFSVQLFPVNFGDFK